MRLRNEGVIITEKILPNEKEQLDKVQANYLKNKNNIAIVAPSATQTQTLPKKKSQTVRADQTFDPATGYSLELCYKRGISEILHGLNAKY